MAPFNNDNWLTVVQIILTVVGGGYALLTYRKDILERRTNTIFSIYTKLYDDPSISRALYAIDKNIDLEELRMKVKELPSSNQSTYSIVKLEKELDKTLQYFNYIGLLVKNNHLKLDDLGVFKYHLDQLFKCPVVIDYRIFLEHLDFKFAYIDELKPLCSPIVVQ